MTQVDNAIVKVCLTGVESNTIVACLAKEEYGIVYELIQDIRNQSTTQIETDKPQDPLRHTFEYTVKGKDIRQIVRTLNKHPFDQVFQLVENIRTQVIPQLEAVSNEQGGE